MRPSLHSEENQKSVINLLRKIQKNTVTLQRNKRSIAQYKKKLDLNDITDKEILKKFNAKVLGKQDQDQDYILKQQMYGICHETLSLYQDNLFLNYLLNEALQNENRQQSTALLPSPTNALQND